MKSNQFYPSLLSVIRAVESLNITTRKEYLKRYKEDSRLTSRPENVYSNEWKGWGYLFNRPPKEPYETIEEASVAVKKLGIRTKSEYMKNYKRDPRLPANPPRTYSYKWKNWPVFFSRRKPSFYSTLREASISAIKLGATSKNEYQRIYKRDSSLPCEPNEVYAREWISWPSFLERQIKKKYESLKEARSAVLLLGVTSRLEYLARYKEDPKLPSDLAQFYSEEWVSWYDFWGKTKPTYYSTLSEAKKASLNIGITSRTDYRKRYRKDPRLPASPDVIYENWKGWYSFLNKPKPTKYETIDEAIAATARLGIKTQMDYFKYYKEDPLLPSEPSAYKGWVDWYTYLGKTKKILYKTLAEASDASRNLGITNSTQYYAKYKADPKLPTIPPRSYKDEWKSWALFLLPQNITSLEDFKVVCQKARILNSVDYRKKRADFPQLPSKPEKSIADWTNWYDALDIVRPYQYVDLLSIIRKNQITSLSEYTKLRAISKDPRIPAKPEEHYQGKGWTNTYDFWGIPRPYQVKYFTEDWRLWGNKITEFLKTARSGDVKTKDLCEFVREYIEPNGLEKCPLDFLTRRSTNIQPMRSLLDQVPVTRKKKWIYSINEFLDWVILNYLVIEDEETGEIAHIKGAKNPFAHINFSGEPDTPSVHETNKLALPYQYVKEGREWIFTSDSISKQPNYSDLVHLHSFRSDWILVDDDSMLDSNDPDCVYKFEDGKTYLWTPMYWTYTYALMQLPARGMQIVYCDSGEADYEIADFKNGQVLWKKNKSGLAGLTNQQGMVSKSGKDEFGVHYTSNKTKFDGSGYTIPFMPIELAYWLIKLRKWQQKYNPIKEPTKWLDCVRTNLNEIQRKQKGVNCFLFRDYGEKEPGIFSGRLSARLAAALFFSSKSDHKIATYRGLSYDEVIGELENHTQIAISRFKSLYTPHSMRVSLINAYAYEFGIPLEVIMKLVGHSSILMTIYYTKSDQTGANLREKMELGEKEALSKATQTLKSFVEQQRIEEVKSQLVGSPMGPINLLDNARPSSSYLWKDFGICPVGGAFCSEGGCPVAMKANIYHPVPAGYLGEQNCVQCRFFITGPAFLVGLAAMFNEIGLAVNTLSSRYTSLELKLDHIAEKIDVIDHHLYTIKADNSEKLALKSKKRGLVNERVHLNSEIETRAKKLDVYLTDMNAIHRHIHNCQTLMNQFQKNTTNNFQLIVPHKFSLDVELDEVSSFHQLSEVCSNAELYHSCSDDLAVTRRSQMIDRMMAKNGIQPQLFFLSEEEQLVVGNQLTELMLTRLKGWENIDRLMDGSLTLKDLSIDNPLDENTIRELFKRSKPLKRIG
ncbi:integrase [Vibrio sp. ZSDZ34]|uniref:Integrase n=1 Tax=Vibrio gelatinilyticus TaxID=2893468 RepID=A0A9X2B0G1_9VIBR|nr:VPA1269 family protein [Vibrio gelatinilyticus]MCJ2378777.1 integrase [Vibrio gelatinilyticus]